LRSQSAAEEREQKAKKRAEWEARQVERANKQIEWETRQGEKKAVLEAKQTKWETESGCTDFTVSTAATADIMDEEVMRVAMMNKEVRKLTKVLRDIEELSRRENLDPLQMAKVARKPEVTVELDGALLMAKVRARNDLARSK